jgi:hypothetical protein
MRMRLSMVTMAGLVLAVILGLTACGGDGNGPAEGTALTATARAGPVELPTVPADAAFVEYVSPDKNYTVSYPSGWVFSSDGFADNFLWSTEEGRPVAQLTVTCNAQALTPDELIDADAAVVARFGRIDPTSIVPIEIAGTMGKQATYTVPAGSVAVEQMVAYAPGDNCGWRIGLASYGAGTSAAFSPVFQRIVASFRPG